MRGWGPVKKRVIVYGTLLIGLVCWFTWMFRLKDAVPPPKLDREDALVIEAIQRRAGTHVQKLAADIGERNLDRPKDLERAASYIRDQWRAMGFTVTLEPVDYRGQISNNLIVEVPGLTANSEMVVIGAHYDSVWGSPGANDNATGVAALLELSRLFGKTQHRRALRWVAFTNEEPPYFGTPSMGSRVHAEGASSRRERVSAMLALETLGCYEDGPGTQTFPPRWGWALKPFFPDQGNFVTFVGDTRSRSLVKKMLRAFQETSDMPVEGLATIRVIPGVDWSDHASFWKHGYRAVMVTDTAPYRSPHYHTAQDTVEKIRLDKLARVVFGLKGVVGRLIDHE